MKLEDDDLRCGEEMEEKLQKQQRDWGLRPWGGMQCKGKKTPTTSPASDAAAAAAAPPLSHGATSLTYDDTISHAAVTQNGHDTDNPSAQKGTYGGKDSEGEEQGGRSSPTDTLVYEYTNHIPNMRRNSIHRYAHNDDA